MRDDTIHKQVPSPKSQGWHHGFPSYSDRCSQSRFHRHDWLYHFHPKLFPIPDLLRVCKNCGSMNFAPEGYPYYTIKTVQEYIFIKKELTKKCKTYKKPEPEPQTMPQLSPEQVKALNQLTETSYQQPVNYQPIQKPQSKMSLKTVLLFSCISMFVLTFNLWAGLGCFALTILYGISQDRSYHSKGGDEA